MSSFTKSIFFEFSSLDSASFASCPIFSFISAIIAMPLFSTMAFINSLPISPAPPVTTTTLSFNTAVPYINFTFS